PPWGLAPFPTRRSADLSALREGGTAERDELERSAQEPLRDGCRRQEPVQDGIQLPGIDATGEQRRRALLAGEHMVQSEARRVARSEEHTSELQSREKLV